MRSSGEVDTVAKLGREDLVNFHRTHYNAQHAVVALMGDVTREEAAAIAGGSDGRAAGRERAGADLARRAGPRARRDALDHASRKPEPHPHRGARACAATTPIIFPLFVGNYVLGGGGFQSRITEEVRTKRGLAYSAYSYFSPMLREGPFVVGMQTKGEQAREALAVVRKTLADFVAQGPTAKELAAAKKNIIGGFPLRIDSNRKIHEYLARDRLLPPAAHLSRRLREERRARDRRKREERFPAARPSRAHGDRRRRAGRRESRGGLAR